MINIDLSDGLDLGFTSGCTSTNPKSYYECVSVLVVSFGCIWLVESLVRKKCKDMVSFICLMGVH